MDQILEGLLDSGQPEGIKAAIINRICEQGVQPSHPSTTVRGVLEVASRWILYGTSNLQVSSGFKLLNSWGVPVAGSAFPTFFTPELVSRLLRSYDQGQGSVIAANVPLLLREGFRVMSRAGHAAYQGHAEAVQQGVANMVRRSQKGDRLTVRNVGLLLREFPECVPAKDAQVLDLCIAILEHLSQGVLPQDPKLILKFIRHTDEIAGFLSALWSSRSNNILEACLSDLFRIISSSPLPSAIEMADTSAGDEPAFCLAAVVQHIPVELANRVVKSVVTDPAITEAAIECAVGQIVEWLKWPSACNVDVWLLCFLTELAAHKKLSLLMRITELNTAQVAENLMYPQLRSASFKVLSQMLLSFQHSPAPFHKALEKLVPILADLQAQSTSSTEAQSWLCSLAGLLQCLMHLHSGFPELYDPVLELIKGCPTLNQDQMKAKLQQSSWLSQVSGSVAVGTGAPLISYSVVTTQKKLEEGKTGLDNLGNTCYMNSILQALYMCDQFRQGILTKIPNSQESVLDKLQQVFALLCQSNRASISPSRLLQASRPPWFLPGQQQDCSEFLKYLLDRLHEEERGQLGTGESGNLMRSLSTSSSGSSVSPGGTLKKSERKAAVTLTSIKMKTDDEMSRFGGQGSNSVPPSLVENTFRGKMKTTLRCLACKAESTRCESFSDIPLAFPNNSSGLANSFPKKSLAGGGMQQAGLSADLTVSPQEGKVTADLADSTQGPKPLPDTTQTVGTTFTTTSAEDEESNCTDTLSLNDLIAFYLKSEQLTGDNKYHCDKCGKLQDGERSITISESPNYLILTLLRFSYNIKLQSRTKIFQDVQYPRTLALPVEKVTKATLTSSASSSSLSKQHSRSSSNSSGYQSEQAQDTTHSDKLKQLTERLSPKTEGSDEAQKRELYGLSAVVIHSGTSSECGHYYCYARHSRSGQVDPALLDKASGDADSIDLLPDKWYNFNDSRVSHANFEAFSNVTKRFSNDTAYVLIYRKLDSVPKVIPPSLEPVLRPDLRDFVMKDNETFLKEQELDARIKEEQRRRSSSVDSAKFNNWSNKKNDDDDDDNDSYRGPGCNPGLGGHDTSGSRFVF